MEWSNASKYNSFNSAKGLAYFGHYQKIVAWLEGGKELATAIECKLYPIS